MFVYSLFNLVGNYNIKNNIVSTEVVGKYHRYL